MASRRRGDRTGDTVRVNCGRFSSSTGGAGGAGCGACGTCMGCSGRGRAPGKTMPLKTRSRPDLLTPLLGTQSGEACLHRAST